MDNEQLIEHFNLDGDIRLAFFRTEQALAREEADAIRQHEDYLLQLDYDDITMWVLSRIAPHFVKPLVL